MFDVDFRIVNEENAFVLRATIDIRYSESLLSGVADTLNSTFNSDRFQATFNATIPSLVIEVTGPNRLLTTQDQLRDFLRGVTFSTGDQAPDVNRTIVIVVEEFPLGTGTIIPTFIPVNMVPVNDQPILMPSDGTTTTTGILNDYLPQETRNLGFNASFLLTDEDFLDLDRQSRITQDFIGLAIIEMDVQIYLQTNLGEWQYYNGSEWRAIPSVSSCNPFFVSPSTSIRFSPFPSFDKQNGQASITYLAWDGSSQDSPCSPPSVGGEFENQEF